MCEYSGGSNTKHLNTKLIFELNVVKFGIGIVSVLNRWDLSHHLFSNDLFVFKELEMKRSLVKLLGLVKSVIEIVTGRLRTTRVAIFVVYKQFLNNLMYVTSFFNISY